MKAKTTTFREIDEAHENERVADLRALRSGDVSVRRLQETNSLIPAGATMQIVGLAGYLKKRRKAR